MFGIARVNILDGVWANKDEELAQTFLGGPRLQEHWAFGLKGQLSGMGQLLFQLLLMSCA